MNEEALNLSVRKFLKTFGVTAQREIETAVREAAKAGRLKGKKTLAATATLSVEGLGLSRAIKARIALE
ncbi:MAG: hypothetical protein HYV05_00175 [Deltaproteobacteria bacterium]|nr:hypothetical protein [Deltaproteobacteria bacterium]MBI4184238.1 hypothetical protein [Pseudomonadota bacterium]